MQTPKGEKRKTRGSRSSSNTPSPYNYKKCKLLTTYNRFSPLGDHLYSPELEIESENTTDVLSNVLSQLQALTASFDLLVEGQSSMNKKLDSLSNRVDAIEQSTKSNAGEISKIKDDYNKLVEVTNEISLVQAKTQSQVQKLEDATKSIPGVEAGIANPENTVVIYGLPETHQEDIYVKVRDMLQCMQKDYTKLTETVRLKSRVNGKPGVVKASFSSVADKVDILRAKQRLKGTQYGKVFIRSSKNHAERLAEINTKVILNNSSWGKDYKLTSNGRLIRRTLPVASSTNSLTQTSPIFTMSQPASNTFSPYTQSQHLQASAPVVTDSVEKVAALKYNVQTIPGNFLNNSVALTEIEN